MSEKKENQLMTKFIRGIKNQKYIDIFLHLKHNIQNSSHNCKCNTNDRYYCIPCKVTCCSMCTYKAHEPHILIQMKENQFDNNQLNKIFKTFETNIKRSKLLFNTKDIKQQMEKDVNDFIDETIQKLNDYRKNKLEIIAKIFEKLEENKKIMEQSIENIKKNLLDFTNKNKKFFNLGKNKEDSNPDRNNTLFLMGYDILNLTNQGINQLYQKIDILEEDLQNYLDDQNTIFSKMRKEISKLFKIEKYSFDSHSNVNTTKSNSKKGKKVDEENNLPNLSSNIGHFLHTTDELGDEYFNPIKERINIYNKHIENFQHLIYKTLNNSGNLKEIEISLKSYEHRKLTGAESLFSQRDMGSGPNTESFVNSSSLNFKRSINTEKDICLNNPLVNKYFGYLFIDLYDKYFKVISKELQSSHADLLVKINEDDEEEENEYGKIIEGTNEIQFYDKKFKKMYKIQVNLTKNPFGYTKFPIGCRSLLLGDKFYISGGRDEYNEYSNVLIYDKKNKHIKRIMDLRIPRAYHTMIYSDVFNSIMVFGGENESSVEIFDPLTNRWQLLPSMKIPRSNVLYYCDNPRGILYTLFGNEGRILDNRYSDVIEFLDLKNIKEGWNILDYQNKSEIDLKTLMNMIPLNSDLILLYGGVIIRGHKRTVCIFNIARSEITKIDNKILGKLRTEAKKSKKLTAIISGLNQNANDKTLNSSNSKMKMDNLK